MSALESLETSSVHPLWSPLRFRVKRARANATRRKLGKTRRKRERERERERERDHGELPFSTNGVKRLSHQPNVSLLILGRFDSASRLFPGSQFPRPSLSKLSSASASASASVQAAYNLPGLVAPRVSRVFALNALYAVIIRCWWYNSVVARQIWRERARVGSNCKNT